jgi:hypothetical protein
MKYFVLLFSIVTLSALLAFLPAKSYLQEVFISNGISLEDSISYYLYAALFFVSMVFVFSIFMSTKRRILKTVNT